MTEYEYEHVDEVPVEDLAEAVENVDGILAIMAACIAEGELPPADAMAQIMLSNNQDMPVCILLQHLALMLSVALHRLAVR